MLEVRQLSMSFGGVKAVAQFALNLAPGEIVALIGPNGAGKTTVLNLISGFLRPESGTIRLNGARLDGLRPDEVARRGLCRSFQQIRLVSELSAMENIVLAIPGQSGERVLSALSPRRRWSAEEKVNRKKARELLERLGLEEHREEKAGSLSYGQQKLVSLACCTARDAKVYLLDEPLAGLDPARRAVCCEILEEMGAAGRGVLFVEHNLDLVRKMSTRVVAMDRGRKLVEGSAGEVLERSEVVESFMS